MKSRIGGWRRILPAGVDLAHTSGWSAGNWVSNVSGRYIENGKPEWDLYGGYSGSLGAVGYGLMAVYCKYPGAVLGATGTRFDYGELCAGLTCKSVYAKYNDTLTRDFVGITNARGARPSGRPRPLQHQPLEHQHDRRRDCQQRHQGA